MTLSRQLAALLLILLTVLTIALTALGIEQQRHALEQQLALSAHDTATALAANLVAALAAGMDAKDAAATQPARAVDLAFDSGDFQAITVVLRDRSAPIQRRAVPMIAPVPGWFGQMFGILPAAAQANVAIVSDTVAAGAVHPAPGSGTVTVIAGSSEAIRALWETSLELCTVAALALLAIAAPGLLMLTIMLRPLRNVVRQAEAISDREYPVLQCLPRQPELRSVVLAMNRTSTKMRAMFSAHAGAMNRLRADSYRDPLTGLANRCYFTMHLQLLLSTADEFNSGALLLIALHDFNGFNQRLGYAAGDELLLSVAQALDQIAGGALEPEYFAARLSGATFALLLSNVGEREAMESGAKLASSLQELRVPGLIDGSGTGHIGIAMYRRQSATQFLAEADTALRSAQAKGPNALHMHETRGEATLEFSITRWGEFLRDVIEKKNIILHLQPVLDSASHRTILQYETLLRVVGEDGQLIPAVIFLPMAKRLGLIQQIDRLVVAEVLARIRQDRYGRIAIAVNLFPATVREPGFMAWLAAALQADPAAAKRIAFEISEQGALDDLDALEALVQMVRRAGGKFGIDHFGRGFSSFGYLATLKLDYLKIDGSFIRGIAHNRDNQFLVDSICKIAHGLDLQVIAESVESDEDWAMLTTLTLDGVQGYGVGIPSEI